MASSCLFEISFSTCPFPIFENIHQRPIKEGVTKEDLKVQVEDDNVLQISGEKVKEKEEKNDKWHHLERQCGGFIRRFQLPENAKMDAISCKMAEGVLTVTVTKKETPPQNKNLRAINVD